MEQPHGHKKYSALKHWIGPAGLMITITCFSGNPAPNLAPLPIVSPDKIAHLAVFGLIATSIYRIHLKVHPRPLALALAVGLASLFGLTDEIHQGMTPDRYMDLGDWIADTVGAVLAVTFYQHWALYRRVLEWGPKKKQPFSNLENDCSNHHITTTYH